jgi:hypothetical protein
MKTLIGALALLAFCTTAHAHGGGCRKAHHLVNVAIWTIVPEAYTATDNVLRTLAPVHTAGPADSQKQEARGRGRHHRRKLDG